MPKLPINDTRIVWPAGRGPGWTHTDSGLDGGRFGSISHYAYGAFGDDSKFYAQFDRPVVVEGPHAIAIPFGRDLSDGKFKIGLVKEQRDTAAPDNGYESVFYWGPPRGFAEPGDAGAIAMAVRETGEEIGAQVLAADPWLIGNYITNETCTASQSPIVAVPVNLERLSQTQGDDGFGEKILKAQFFSLDKIEDMIREGEYDDGLTTSMVLGHTMFLYRLYLRQLTLTHPSDLVYGLKNAWYP